MVTIYPDYEAMSQAAAEIFVEEAHRAAVKRGRFAVLLSGGETPRRCYELLAQEPMARRIPWQVVEVFWGDERFVPYQDPRNNARSAREALLDQVPLSIGQMHPIATEPSPRESAADYDRKLHRYFAGGPPRFDLVFLGLGTNGHTAGLFPGSAAIEEQQRWVTETYLPDEDLFRITLTAPLLNRSALVVFLVAGESKAPMLREVLEGPLEPLRLPAQLIRPLDGRVVWLADAAAGRLLRHPLEAI